jgi:DNA-binding IclR family transcriptional regulator
MALKVGFENLLQNFLEQGSLSTDKARYSVLAVERALRIMRSFSYEQTQLGYSEIAEQTDIPQSTVYKLLQLLVEENFIEQNDRDGTYSIGPEVFRLGKLYVAGKSLVELANPWLEELVRRLGFTATLGVIDQDSLIPILTRLGTSPLSLSREPLLGGRSPVYRSALGKALILDMQADELKRVLPSPPWPQSTPNTVSNLDQLMEELEEARRVGATQDNEETSTGMRCVGFPIRDHQGRTVAAISVTATTIEITDDSLPRVIETIREIGSEISASLGYDSEHLSHPMA